MVCNPTCMLIFFSGSSITLRRSWPTQNKKFGYPRLNLNAQVSFALYGVGARTTANTDRYTLFASHVNTRTIKGKLELK